VHWGETTSFKKVSGVPMECRGETRTAWEVSNNPNEGWGGGLEAGGVNSGIHSPAAQNEGSGAKRKALGPAAQQLPSPRSPMAAHPIEAHQGNYGAGGDLTSPAPALQRLSKHPRRPTPDPHPQSDCVSSQKPSRQSRERA
jgi:hypothetical protein